MILICKLSKQLLERHYNWITKWGVSLRTGWLIIAFLQVFGAVCMVMVILTHVCEALHLSLWMLGIGT